MEVVVGVGHVHGQDPADVRQVRGAADLLALRLHLEAGAIEAAHGVHERERRGVVVLAEQVDLVAQADERADERGVVDVAARSAQQVAVEDQDPQGRRWSPGARTPDMFPRL